MAKRKTPRGGRDQAWWAGERLCGDLASFVIFILLARLLVPADYGAISLVNVLVALGAALVTNGVGSALASAEAAERSTAFFARLALGLLLWAAAFFTAPLLERFFRLDGLGALLRVLALLLPLSALRAEQSAFAARLGLGKRAFLLSLVSAAASLALGILLALGGYGVWALAGQLLLKTALDALLYALFLRWRPGLGFSKAALGELLKRERRGRLTDFLDLFFAQLPCLVLGRFAAPEALAYYARGQRDPEIVTKGVEAGLTALLPEGETPLARLRGRLTAGGALLFPALLGLMAVAAPVAAWVLTERWLPFVPYLRLCCLCFMALAVLRPCREALEAAGEAGAARLLCLLQWGGVTALLILGCLMGASALTLALIPTGMAALAALAGLILCARRLGYKPQDILWDLLPSLLLSLLMAAAVYALASLLGGAGLAPVWLVGGGVALGVILYGGLGLLLRLPALRLLTEAVKARLRPPRRDE